VTVARRWRLRHKLLLGAGLVIATIGLLLVGTLYGLTNYNNTVKASDDKIVELNQAESLRASIVTLGNGTNLGGNRTDQAAELTRRLEVVRQELARYRALNDQSVSRSLDMHRGVMEGQLCQQIEEGLARYDDLLGKIINQPMEADRSPDLGNNPQLQETVAKIVIASSDLGKTIYSELFRNFAVAKRRGYWSGGIVIAASVLAVMFLGCLVYFFSSWVFSPIRRLQAGVGRVTVGDFTQPIRLRSGDELQELADAFDAMTLRVKLTYDDLSQQVEERSRQLVRSERLASVGFLAAGVAHEINNPLASIAFCSEALEARLEKLLARAPDEAETVRKYLRMIHHEAFRCKQITQRLLEFSRAGERKRDPLELSGLVQSVLEVAQHLPNCRGKRVMFQPALRVTAPVNGPEVSSVVLNLVVNALESMEDGGTLTITLGLRGPWAELTFSDTGCGMTPDVLENIFEPFFTRSRTGKGTGLGLSISHQIVAQHGGEIEASSAGPGRGSTFTVRLPLTAAEVPAAVAVAPTAAVPARQAA
jgi:two-component system NtrC family sensor kinase